jgi:hypothetical protein
MGGDEGGAMFTTTGVDALAIVKQVERAVKPKLKNTLIFLIFFLVL